MKPSNDTYLIKVSIVLLIIVIILFSFILWRQFRYATGGRSIMPFHVSLNLRRRSGPLPVSSATSIQSWMTFDYIDYLFGLPPSYLKTALDITAANYPRISVDHYAALSTTTPTSASALAAVKKAIESYNPASVE